MTEGIPGPHGGQAYDGPQRGFGARLLGALKLDASVYEEVEHDRGALGQAAGVVALAALAQGIGAASEGGLAVPLAGVLGAILGWFLATAVIWLVGVQLLGHSSDYPELLRTTGFASAPAVLAALLILPLGPLRGLLGFGIWLLSIVAYVVAVRQALDTGTGRAIAVVLLANVAALLLAAALFFLLVGSVPGGGDPGAYMP